MSNEFVLKAEVRENVGKGSSRRLRRLEDKMPAIIYGGKDKSPQNITLSHKDMVKALENEAFFSHIITLDVDSKKEDVIIKDLQRHPAKARVLHADFLRVSKDVAITVNVPLHFINEESSIGVKQQGGVATHSMTEVEISCLPGNLPEYIEVDMAEVELDQIVHLSEVKLPEGVELLAFAQGQDEDNDQPIAAIHVPKKMEEPEEEVVDTEAEADEDQAEDTSDEESEGDDED